jgi:ankyrin repeat protein
MLYNSLFILLLIVGFSKTLFLSAMYLDHISQAQEALNQSLFDALRLGTDSEIFVTIQKGANVNSADRDGLTPLHSAAIHNRRYAAELLIRNNAHLNRLDDSGKTPLFYAASYGHNALCHLLLSYNVPFPMTRTIRQEAIRRATPFSLAQACIKGNSATAQPLLDNISPFELFHEVDAYGFTTLHWAAARGHVKITQLLLEKAKKYRVNFFQLNSQGLLWYDIARRNVQYELLEQLSEYIPSAIYR